MTAWRTVSAAAGVAGLLGALSIASAAGVTHADTVDWQAIAQCESGGNWAADTGNGAYGGLQIKLPTWNANHGAELSTLPSTARPEEQVLVGQRIMATQGPKAWPRCTSCSQEAAPMGSLTHLLTSMWSQAGGCTGSSRAAGEAGG